MIALDTAQDVSMGIGDNSKKYAPRTAVRQKGHNNPTLSRKEEDLIDYCATGRVDESLYSRQCK